MKRVLKAALVLVLVLAMVATSLTIVAAEEATTPADDEVVISAAAGGGDASIQAYDLVWRYRTKNGILQRRRWNATLGEWYDPYWMNVHLGA